MTHAGPAQAGGVMRTSSTQPTPNPSRMNSTPGPVDEALLTTPADEHSLPASRKEQKTRHETQKRLVARHFGTHTKRLTATPTFTVVDEVLHIPCEDEVTPMAWR